MTRWRVWDEAYMVKALALREDDEAMALRRLAKAN